MDLLAHQGGWDEILFVAAPVAIFAGLLWLARLRADHELEEEGAEHDHHAVRPDER